MLHKFQIASCFKRNPKYIYGLKKNRIKVLNLNGIHVHPPTSSHTHCGGGGAQALSTAPQLLQSHRSIYFARISNTGSSMVFLSFGRCIGFLLPPVLGRFSPAGYLFLSAWPAHSSERPIEACFAMSCLRLSDRI